MKSKFVRCIPDKIDEDILYIAQEHGTCIHLCACGCGEKAPIPLGHNNWTVRIVGGKLSLTPSILQKFKCKSHYSIISGKIVWANHVN